jgi:hypothetical protein
MDLNVFDEMFASMFEMNVLKSDLLKRGYILSDAVILKRACGWFVGNFQKPRFLVQVFLHRVVRSAEEILLRWVVFLRTATLPRCAAGRSGPHRGTARWKPPHLGQARRTIRLVLKPLGTENSRDWRILEYQHNEWNGDVQNRVNHRAHTNEYITKHILNHIFFRV